MSAKNKRESENRQSEWTGNETNTANTHIIICKRIYGIREKLISIINMKYLFNNMEKWLCQNINKTDEPKRRQKTNWKYTVKTKLCLVRSWNSSLIAVMVMFAFSLFFFCSFDSFNGKNFANLKWQSGKLKRKIYSIW